MANVVKVPPDGGYGWVIVFASALSNLIIIPIIQSFGLIFKDTFTQMGLSGTQGSLIINLNAAFGMMTGLINGVLLKVFGYRKVAFAGSFFVVVGIVSTSFATTFTHFIVAYGLITSLGMGLSMSAYSLALNSYFRKNRGKAIGYAMTITGLGPILMPQLISLLTQSFNVQGVILILGGISAHCFVAAALLHPVQWHVIAEKVDEEKLDTIEEGQEEDTKETEALKNGPRTLMRSVSHSEARNRNDSTQMGSNWSIDPDIETAAIYGLDSTLGGSVLSLQSVVPRGRAASIVSQTWKKTSNLNLQSGRKFSLTNDTTMVTETVYNPDLSQPIKKKTLWKRILSRLSSMFDLDLFRDPIYINIMIGMSFAIFAEINFSVLTAFILADLGLTTEQSATFMSVLGIADILFRFLSPYIADYMNRPPRVMYLFTLLLLMSTRFSLLISNNFIFLMGVALGLGVAKGVRTVYMSLVIPSYVPIEKLASASGVQMMVNGVFIMIGGPIIGLVRDITGSYTMPIVIINCVTLTTVLMWTVELIIVRIRKDKKETVELTEQKDNLLSK